MKSPKSKLTDIIGVENGQIFFVFKRLFTGSSVGIVTAYGLDGPGIESRWGARFFRTCPDRP